MKSWNKMKKSDKLDVMRGVLFAIFISISGTFFGYGMLCYVGVLDKIGILLSYFLVSVFSIILSMILSMFLIKSYYET